VMESNEQFEAMGKPAGGLVKNGRNSKFLIDNRKSPRTLYFVNGNYKDGDDVPEYVQYHYDFAAKFLELGEEYTSLMFNQDTYFLPKKKFFAGTLHTYDVPGKGLVYGFQFYPQDIIQGERVYEALATIKKVFRIPKAKMAFVATGQQQVVDK